MKFYNYTRRLILFYLQINKYFLDLQKNLLKSPIYGLHGGHYNLHPLIGGHHCQRDNQCNDPMNNNKHKCRIQYLYPQAQVSMQKHIP